MKESENEETDTKVLYAPAQFYDSCDDCDTLPEDRWEEFRSKLEEEKKKIIEGRERVQIDLFFPTLKMFFLLSIRLFSRHRLSLNAVPVVCLRLVML